MESCDPSQMVDLEAQVLATLWAADEPLSVVELVDQLASKGNQRDIARAADRLTQRDLALRLGAADPVRYAPTDAASEHRARWAQRLLAAVAPSRR